MAAFITVFCLVASKAVLSSNIYLSRVIKAKNVANRQLNDNLKSFDSLQQSYKAFDKADVNVINGKRDGNGDNDGSNSKIVLDALPSSYDFPALTSSIEKMMNDRSLKVSSITGTDDQVNQQGNISSAKPVSVSMPFTFTVDNANYDAVKKLVDALDHSIRPMVVDTFEISGGGDKITVTVNAHTYFQPAKNLNITKQVVK
jgi:hypothetical protein